MAPEAGRESAGERERTTDRKEAQLARVVVVAAVLAVLLSPALEGAFSFEPREKHHRFGFALRP